MRSVQDQHLGDADQWSLSVHGGVACDACRSKPTSFNLSLIADRSEFGFATAGVVARTVMVVPTGSMHDKCSAETEIR